jgi:D-arabinose 1-dehydrogenase-like Zn-dependent alcohol dehydrogenase
MKSYQVIDFGQPLRETELPDPSPTGHEIVVAVEAAGVCHSDLHIWEGSYDLGHGKKLMLKDRGIPLPLTMGHETAGKIVAIGAEVVDRKVGERVLVFPWIGCGLCRVCRDGFENLCAKPRSLGVYCDGGYATEIVVPHERHCIPIEGLDPIAIAPLACSGLTAYSALKKFGDILKEEPLLIIGAGGLGLTALSLLKAFGGKGAAVVDIDAGRREAALEAGALKAIDGDAPDALMQVLAALGGPCSGAIDFVGAPATAALGFDALAKGGKLVMVGLFGGAAPWSLPLVPMKAASIIGSYTGSLGELKELVDLARRGAFVGIPISKRPLGGATGALEDLKAGRVVGRVVLTP